MTTRAAFRAALTRIALLPGVLLLAACGGASDTVPEATETGAAALTDDMPAVDATGAADDPALVSTAAINALDPGALAERRDPERLLRYYTTAIRQGDWKSAARAWTLDAQMTPEKLEAQFSGASAPKLAVGKGDVEGAAGSLYYEAPLTVSFADNRASLRGTIVLRRVNDVPGATEEQLNWRIERSSILPQ